MSLLQFLRLDDPPLYTQSLDSEPAPTQRDLILEVKIEGVLPQGRLLPLFFGLIFVDC